ncbi:MAG: glycosyltransferase family 2 protein, partial [Gaiella sp.]
MTLLARDEADIIEGQIRFHLAAGVDFFIVTDHGSCDGTTEILSRLAHEGVAHVIREDGATLRQSEWVTRMARLAALEHGADWVINSDADEFWLPSGGGLKQVLSLMPERIGVVETFVRPFLPHDGPEPFHQRMVFRLTARAAINDPSSPFRVNTRLLHRADGRVTVGTGNTSISGFRRPRLTGWAPVEVLHFPIRSFAHFERKFLAHFHTVEAKRRDHIRAHEAASAGRLAELYAEICVG